MSAELEPSAIVHRFPISSRADLRIELAEREDGTKTLLLLTTLRRRADGSWEEWQRLWLPVDAVSDTITWLALGLAQARNRAALEQHKQQSEQQSEATGGARQRHLTGI